LLIVIDGLSTYQYYSKVKKVINPILSCLFITWGLLALRAVAVGELFNSQLQVRIIDIKRKGRHVFVYLSRVGSIN